MWLEDLQAAQCQDTLRSVAEVNAAPLKKMRSHRPEASALAQLSLELQKDLSSTVFRD